MAILVTMRHARAASLSGQKALCAPGVRAWCQHHGIDLHQFVEQGLPIDVFEQLDDAFARRMVAIARAEVTG
ncbi:hypothetical protein [Dyella terrae]|uniref:hypothetical protein n=1 Tax=Dyella terrae TaxID=522259 RepID=UPI001EFE3F8A|nr:hypothetical protein [Dyella terrae]ULU26585.1 hypothetical protein DYST_03531 [Dyella terrae]